jgi:hypothetical protein
MITKLRCLAALFAGFIVFSVSCGSGSSRMITAIAVTPAAVTLQDAGNNKVQFSAMGTFNTSPTTAPIPVLWTIGNPFQPGPFFNGVSVDQTGLAQCTTFTGTVSVFATAPPDPKMSPSTLEPLSPQVSGAADLTCQ